MMYVALRMLLGDRAKYFGLIFGLTFASLVLTQQSAVFLGLMTRTFGAITDTGVADIWVMDPKVQYIDDIKPMSDTALLRVRGIEGVDWAVPLYKSLLKARLENGNFQSVNVFGLDDATLAGGPHTMLEGRVEDLRMSDAVIVDSVGAQGKLAKPPSKPGGKPTPLHVGDSLELNDRRAVVVGICKVSRTFQSQPVLYTTYSRATTFAPHERKMLSFILVKAKPGIAEADLCARIRERTGLEAYEKETFIEKTMGYFMKYTGIPINFGTAVALGFVVGVAIVAQLFYSFTLENLRYFATLKAMGASNFRLLRMILLQALLVGATGYGIGVGLASLFGYSFRDTELAFRLPWQLLLGSAGAVMVICALSAALSLLKVVRLEPAVVFKA
ncbi:MAG: FtsX-like permease family protein [Planctomycetes bacterium]|nr:FtsX-like permease family protein [Planctomycetota bacterium]